MAFDVSALTAHIEENSTDFAMKAITGSKIWPLGCDIRQGIKAGTTVKIPTLLQDAPFYAASACTVNSSGTTTFNQINVTNTAIAISPQWCLYDLEPYFLQMGLKPGAKEDSLSFMNKILDRLAAIAARNVGMQLIQGKQTYTNATYLKQINGFIAALDTNGTAISGNTGSETSITASNIIAIMDKMIAAIPNRVFLSSNPQVWMGADTYRLLVQAQRNANAFNYFPTPTEYGGLSQIFPGTNVKVIAIDELNNDNPVETGSLPTAVKNRIFALNPDNVVIAVDKQNDFSDFRVWFDNNTNLIKSYGRFSLGTTCKFYDEIVQYTNA